MTFSRLLFALLFLSFAANAQSFQPGVLYPTQNGPQALATADFNGDGKLDLAVGNAASSSISIFIGKGDGTFTPGPIVAIPGNCLVTSLTPGDFTGDGKVDLLAACGFQSTLWVLPGLGGGQFGSAVSTTLQQYILMGFAEGNFQGVAVADFNGDGKLDVAIELSNGDVTDVSVNVMLGNGNGTFQAPSPAPVMTAGVPGNVVAADINRDGKPDLIVTVSQNTSRNVSFLLVLLGDGKGGFEQVASYSLSTEALLGFATVTDVNRDAIPDLILASTSVGGNGNPTSFLTVFTGNGDGTLKQSFSSSEPDLMVGLLAADFSGTGTPDLIEVTALSVSDNATVTLMTRVGNGDGTFQNPIPIPLAANLSPWWFSLVAGDWNADGLPDFAFVSLPVLQSISKVNGSGFGAIVSFYDSFPAESLVVMLNAATPPPSAISVQTNPSGLQFTVDGQAPQTAPKTLSLSQGSHTITVLANQPGTTGTQYIFTGWGDGATTASRSITVGDVSATYTANFQTQYQLTIAASPAAAGKASPTSGSFFASGTAVAIAATANSGYQFTSWTGPAANTGSASTSVTMNAPETVTASFTPMTTVPAFFNGQVSLGSGVYYLQFPDGNLFGYFNYVASSILYHYDMGYEAFVPGSAADVYLYDFTSNHWLYTSSALFPYLYDFTLSNWLYYFPDSKSPGHYTASPRSFSNLTTGKIFTM